MAPVLDILPERAEQNKDFEVGDLLPWSENEVVVLGSVSAGNAAFDQRAWGCGVVSRRGCHGIGCSAGGCFSGKSGQAASAFSQRV